MLMQHICSWFLKLHLLRNSLDTIMTMVKADDMACGSDDEGGMFYRKWSNNTISSYFQLKMNECPTILSNAS